MLEGPELRGRKGTGAFASNGGRGRPSHGWTALRHFGRMALEDVRTKPRDVSARPDPSDGLRNGLD